LRVLFDAAHLKCFMEHFFAVSQICVSVFDCDMNLIASTEDKISTFCLKVRDNAVSFNKCLESNERAFRKVLETHQTHIYTCHAGLCEVVSPIMGNDAIVGFLMIGQFLPANEEEKWWGNLEKGHGCVQSLTELKATYSHLKVIPENELHAWVEIVNACASYIWVKQYLRLYSDEKFTRIDRYVHENLSVKLSADSLSSALGLPKSALYNIVKQNANLSLGDYIRFMRIEKAKELLARTDLPVAAISGLVGMDDYNYFSRIFKDTVHETPRDYRKKFLPN